MTFKQEIVQTLIKQYPNASSRSLARMLVKKEPKVFMTFENAYSQVRYARGASGAGQRKKKRAVNFPPSPFTTGIFADLPNGKEEVEITEPLQLDGPFKALILCDIHFPFQDKLSLATSCINGLENGCNLILLNGDIIDMYGPGNEFVKDPRLVDFKGDRDLTASFFEKLRKMFPKAKIIFKEGNHEERYSKWLKTKAAEMLEMPEFQLSKVLQLADFDILHVGDKRLIRLGQLNVLHGHEYRQGIAAPVNPARGLFLRAKEHCLQGDRHQVSMHTEKTVSGQDIVTWSTGCLCKLNPRYLPFNGWRNGFARVEVDKGNKFRVFNYTVKDGNIY